MRTKILTFLFIASLTSSFSQDKGNTNNKSTKLSESPITRGVSNEVEDGDPDIGDLSAPGIFYDKFEGNLDTNVWIIHNTVWGLSSNEEYHHGGVIRENCYTENGHAVMRSFGDYYSGSLKATNGRTTRIGGAMYTKKTFASGRYEIKMMPVQRPNMGILSSPWTYRSESLSPKDDSIAYNKALSKGANILNETITINSEIDIELKGTDLANPIMKHWLTVEKSAGGATQLPINLNDGKFHIYRWDWHTGGHGEEARVEYYIDDILYRTITEYVPYMSANMTIGNWFAWWASLDLDGTYKAPLFDTDYMYVDWLKITPFYEAEDDWFRTSGQTAYPDWVAHKIPGNIQAINFDRGGESISYHSNTASNTGNGSRQDESINTNTDKSIGTLTTGEWVEYTTHIATTSDYTIKLNIASANANPGSFKLEIDDTNVTGTINAINTNSNTTFESKEIEGIHLTSGQHVLKFYVESGGFRLKDISFETIATKLPHPDAG